jgi:hypothetical protein
MSNDMFSDNKILHEIPFIDIRNSSLIELLKQHLDKAKELIDASKNAFGLVSRLASHLALPIGDNLSRKWLKKTKNPYFDEIEQYTKILPIKGIFALNLCYEWGCTSGAYRYDKGVKLVRVLDWPFPALGENIVVAHQRGGAGDFYNITWPGISGIFQAMAPGRFAAALNQAPMRRYKTGVIIDWIRNRGYVNKHQGLPPAHLLRKAFETANNYNDAKAILVEQPISIPAIYILGGTKTQEGCVIERLEDSVRIREIGTHNNVCAANHFESSLNGIGHGWLPRAMDSHGRAKNANLLSCEVIADNFTWFQSPIANPLSRLVMVADAAKETFSLMGTDGITPVTRLFSL